MKVKVLSHSKDMEETICRAARNDYMSGWVGDTSFEDIMKGVKGETETEKKLTLIGHLMKHGHWGPFEQNSITFAVSGISRSCMAQITRHRLASFDVQSMRYVKFDKEEGEDVKGLCIGIPELTDPGVCGRSAKFTEYWKKQHNDDILKRREELYWEAINQSYETYNKLLDVGVAPENARMVLPIGTKFNFVVTLNVRSLLHIADMRAAADAQWEIRELTELMLKEAENLCPNVFGYYNEHMRKRVNRLAP